MAENIRGWLRIPREGELALEGVDFAWEIGHGKSERGAPVVILKLTNPEDDLDFVPLGLEPERAAVLAAALTQAQNEASGQGLDTVE